MAFMQKLAADPSNARVASENILDMPAAVEEGVQLAKPQGVTPRDGNKVDNSYGSLQKLVRPSTGVEVFGNKAYGYMQQLVVAIAALWLLFTLGSHLGSRLSSDASRARSSSPAPAPGAAAGSQPSCRSYEYPQCEAAMHGYLLLSARSRCEAFERVKAEGDFFKFPYSATSQETCTSPGCCSCPGQCSKCPPILPECSTWQLDGTWKVAFADGTAGKYRFDAHGHCEMELPASALPTTWKAYQQAYIPQGNDLNSYPRWLSVQDAERLCTQAPDCRGITYDESSRTNTQDSQPVFFIYLKSTAAFAPGPGTGWIAHVEEQKPELHGQAAVAGPVLEQSREAAGAFFFDLHQAAPQLFPEDSLELFTVVNDELRVQRLIRGSKVQSGVGIPLK
mmetsp:Transcript_38898/g.72045  ORF Transcript_38898/g.72045 Transcript_38898/m.72045 type:complete len:393 (-) Transcript_38898:84-1262(-)